MGEFKPEYTGKLNFYINSIDAQLRGMLDEPTIGILLCKTPNKTVIEYSLKGLDKPLGVADYKFHSALPDEFKEDLPTVEELERELEKDIDIPSSSIETRLKSIKERVERLKKPKIEESKSEETIRKIVDGYIYPLWDSFKLKSTELRTLFKYDRSTLEHTSHRFYEKDDFENKLKEEPNPYELRICLNLDGFIPAGTEAFQVYRQLTIRLLELKYQIFYDNDRKPEIEFLYHQLPSKSEIEVWANKLTEDLATDIEERLDGIDANN